MGEKTDKLVEEIVDNLRQDRKKLVVVRDKLVAIVSGGSLMAIKGSDDGEDNNVVLGAMELIESLAKISDVMCKQTNQLLEISKVVQKNDSAPKDESADKDALFDEIAEEPAEEKTGGNVN